MAKKKPFDPMDARYTANWLRKCGPVKTSDLGKEIIQRRRELAEKTIHRINCCIENRCNDCDLNKRFDDGVCYDSVMAEAKSLLYAAYVLHAEI